MRGSLSVGLVSALVILAGALASPGQEAAAPAAAARGLALGVTG